jgi:Domain of unknown function (DUF1707)
MAASDTLVSDAERERAADRLRTAAGEGRLTTEEFSERIDRAYAARTHGQLEEVLVGLPKPAQPARPRRSARERLWRLALWFVPPNLVCIGVWAASGANGDFWPKWVLLGTGIRLLFGARRLVFEEHGPPRLPPPPPGLGPRR